jgi:CDP-diacylglycerol---serine O-phosphatidyltransferase
MMRFLPNLLTLFNVFCGCVAVVFAVRGHLEYAALFVFLGIFFDYFDGLAARLLNVQSDLGIQLDSLADMVTSGLVPGIVMFQLMEMSQAGSWIPQQADSTFNWADLFPFLGFLITLASAYRLARFNIDENQVSSFIGLPTPANALLILSLPLVLLYQGNEYINAFILNPWILTALTLISSVLLNAPITLFALKFKNWGFRDNAVRYIFVILSFILVVTLKFMAIPVIILLYVLSSLGAARSATGTGDV